MRLYGDAAGLDEQLAFDDEIVFRMRVAVGPRLCVQLPLE
jgi:hypothetical protein